MTLKNSLVLQCDDYYYAQNNTHVSLIRCDSIEISTNIYAVFIQFSKFPCHCNQVITTTKLLYFLKGESNLLRTNQTNVRSGNKTLVTKNMDQAFNNSNANPFWSVYAGES